MFSVGERGGLYVNIGTWIFFAHGYYFILPQIAQMDTDFYHEDEYVLNTRFVEDPLTNGK